MIEIDAIDIDKAYLRFCDVMGVPHKKLMWRSILEFSVFVGWDVFGDPEGPPLYPNDVSRKISAINGPHGETIVRVYKVRRNTTIGRVWVPIKKFIYGAFLWYWIGRAEFRIQWRRYCQ